MSHPREPEAGRSDAQPGEERLPLIIDTDMGVDDVMAILYLLRRPEMDVKALTLTGAGLARCEPGVRNALGLLALADRTELPVACGRSTPLRGTCTFPEPLRHRAETLAGVSLPEPRSRPSPKSAVGLLTSVLEESPRKVAVLALGNLTNLAEAFEATPSLVERVEVLYAMGGALRVPGNVATAPGSTESNPFAEWNIYVDPYAAARVFERLPVRLVPLDATNHVPVTEDFLRRLEANRRTPEADWVYRLLVSEPELVRSGAFFLWDPLAAAALTEPGLVTFEPTRVEVVQEGPQRGRVRETPEGSLIRAAVDADSRRFEALFLETLNG